MLELLVLLLAGGELTIGRAPLPAGTKVTLESRTHFRDRVRSEPEAEPVEMKMTADFHGSAKVLAADDESADALFACSRMEMVTVAMGETVRDHGPIHGRHYVVFRRGEDFAARHADPEDDPGAPEPPAEELSDEEGQEVALLATSIVEISPLSSALEGRKLAVGAKTSLEPEVAQEFFAVGNQGAAVERCEIELVGPKRVGAHDCAVFKVRMRRVDPTEPDFDFEIVEEVEGELVATLAHGFPVACKLTSKCTPRPRKGPQSEESPLAPEPGGVREWTWSARLESSTGAQR